jgi:hypothetical protein
MAIDTEDTTLVSKLVATGFQVASNYASVAGFFVVRKFLTDCALSLLRIRKRFNPEI